MTVFDRLRARAARGSKAPHDDGARIALVVEGGAMRGVVSAGMVAALETLGLTDAFDAVYGSSAGAINAAYFLAGQSRLGSRIYFEDINTRQFIDLRRALIGRPVVDLGFLLDDVAVRRKPLDVGRVLTSSAPLTVLATDVAAETGVAFRTFTTGAHLLSALRAGATMPVVAGPPHEHLGRRYLDASLSEPIPVATAEADGHTHLLVLLTRTGEMRARPSAFDRYFVAPRLKRISPMLAAHYLERAAPYATLVRTIDQGTGPAGRAEVIGIRVSDLHVSKLERRASVLRAGADRGFAAVMAAFGERRRDT